MYGGNVSLADCRLRRRVGFIAGIRNGIEGSIIDSSGGRFSGVVGDVRSFKNVVISFGHFRCGVGQHIGCFRQNQFGGHEDDQ